MYDDMHHDVRAPKPWVRWLLLLVILAATFVIGYVLGSMQNQSGNEAANPTAATVVNSESASVDATAMKQETADWKTYTNTNYGYSVQHPNTWTVQEDTVNVSILEAYVADTDLMNAPLRGEIEITVRKGDATHQYADWTFDRYFKYLTTGGTSEGETFEPVSVSLDQQEPIKVDGVDAILVPYSFDVSGSYGAFVKHGSDIVTISLTARSDYQPKMISTYGETLKNLLSTFAFTQ